MLLPAASIFKSLLSIMVYSEKVTDENIEEALKLGHRLVDGVTKDIEATAVQYGDCQDDGVYQ